MWFCRLIKNCFALKDVDLRWVRVSANAAVSLVAVNFAFRQFAGRKLPGLFRCGSSSEKIFAFVKSFFGVLLRKTYLICFVKESVPVSYQDCDIFLWTLLIVKTKQKESGES